MAEDIEILKRKLQREQQARKEAEKIIENKSFELYFVNKELNNFAHIIAHDLKAPLRAIATLAGWLASDYADKLDDVGKEQLLTLTQRAQALNDMVDAVLQYSKAGRVRGEKTHIDLNILVNEITHLLDPPSHINISVQNPLPIVFCSSVDISQILQNLISNAIKYIDKPKGKIKIFSSGDEYRWRIGVSDNGVGIEERYFDQIFKIFQTLSNTDEKESTGIGLSIVKKIVEMNNGKIWLESKRGEGSTFYFTIAK